MAENKAFTSKVIKEIEAGVIRKDPLFALALLEYLNSYHRLAVWQNFYMIRFVEDDNWHISFGLLS